MYLIMKYHEQSKVDIIIIIFNSKCTIILNHGDASINHLALKSTVFVCFDSSPMHFMKFIHKFELMQLTSYVTNNSDYLKQIGKWLTNCGKLCKIFHEIELLWPTINITILFRKKSGASPNHFQQSSLITNIYLPPLLEDFETTEHSCSRRETKCYMKNVLGNTELRLTDMLNFTCTCHR